MCFVLESLTATMGNCSTPSFCIALRRMTPVVVSSVEPLTGADQRAPLVLAQGLDPAADRRREVVEPVQRDHVQRADQIGPVVLRHVGPEGERLRDVGVVGVVVLALDRVDVHPVVPHEVRGDVVLGRERVRGAERDLGAGRPERHHEIGGLGGDVEAGRELAGP